MVGTVVTRREQLLLSANHCSSAPALCFLISSEFLISSPEIWLLIENHVIPPAGLPSVFIGCSLGARPAGGAEDRTE